MVIDSVSDEASLLLPLLENQYDDIVSSQCKLKFMRIRQNTIQAGNNTVKKMNGKI